MLDLEPRLGGIITVGFSPPATPQVAGGRRIPPHGSLTATRTPWGRQPGLLDGVGPFIADLDLLSPERQALLAQRLDAGGCTLVATASEAPWAALADRVAFLHQSTPPPPPSDDPRPLSLAEAARLVARAAAERGVTGNRAESFALLAARTIARAAGRRRLLAQDVAEAVALVLEPRARQSPPPQQAEAQAHPYERAPSIEPAGEQPPDHPQPAQAPPLPDPRPAPRPGFHGAPVRSVAGRARRGSLDLPATLLAALPWQRLRQPSLTVCIHPTDLRWHLRRVREGRLILFVVDASGSMGARRLTQAKSAVLTLLQQAYRRRDRVALIVAAGDSARLALPPARAVEQARRRLTGLRPGGATPLAGGLALAYDLALKARRREDRRSVLLLLTDGRANRPLRTGGGPAELQRLSLAIRRASIPAVVAGEPGPDTARLARWLGAERTTLTGRALTAAARPSPARG